MKIVSTFLLTALFVGTSYLTGIAKDVINFFTPKETAASTYAPAIDNASSFGTTGVDDVVTKALAFKASLSNSQQSTLEKTYTASLARKWSNLPCGSGCRNGVELSDLNSTQLGLALQVIEAAAGASANQGYNEFNQIRLADFVLGDQYNANGYDSTIYFIAFLNTPTATGQWMLQFGGHHYASNIAFNSGKVVGATPQFRGVEPTTFTVNGTTYSPLSDEITAMRNMLASFTSAELTTAKNSSTFSDCLMSPGESNGNINSFPSTKQGIAASTLDASQQALVLAAIEPYIKDVDDSTASILRTLYANEINSTYVTWTGSGTSGMASSFLNANTNYARIDGPHVWVEFICQNGVVISSQIHYHTVWRDHYTDYGADLTNTALPVSLTDFSAKLAGSARVLTWKTASEASVSHYEIERSTRGAGGYATVEQVPAKNGSFNSYSFTDNSRLSEKAVYYRLKIVESGDRSRYSNVVALRLKGAKTFLVYPNPAANKITLTLPEAVTNATVNIYDLAGKLVCTKKEQSGAEIPVETIGLSSGNYTVKVMEKGVQSTANFIKQ